MSVQLRDESPGYHHVVTRGNNKRTIFEDDLDRESFCRQLDRVATKYGWRVIAYALMVNHYHLVLRVGDRGLSQGMCELNTGHATAFNVRHGRINHLFGKRYWNRWIRTDAELMNVVRYVVENPRRAGGSRPLAGYAWTSYGATIGLALSRVMLARDELLAFFGRTAQAAVAGFREFCGDTAPRDPSGGSRRDGTRAPP